MWRIIPACCALLVAATVASADLKTASRQLVTGHYDDALRLAKNVRGPTRFEAQLLAVEILRLRGDIDGAMAMARRLGQRPGERGTRAQIALAVLLRDVGRLDESKRLLEPLASKELASKTVRKVAARYELAMTYRVKGLRDRARQMLRSIYDDYQSGRLDEKNASVLFYLAEAGRFMESFEFAKGFYADALSLDRELHRANIAWGDMFLFKYNIGDAEVSYSSVLQIDPNHPDANAGMARVAIEKKYDIAAALLHLERALATNPTHSRSLRLRAELEIDKNQWSQAKATLAQILDTNPNDLRARAQLATIHWLRGNQDGYRAEKSKVFASNPSFAEFFHIVVRSAVREHRYREAIELSREALQVDPEFYLAMSEVGAGYLRMGKEKLGLKWLRRAYEKDGYNVRTVNLLELFETVIPRDYETSTSKNFRFRFHKEERPILERHLIPVLERAFADMRRRYRFTPKAPTTIELYRDADHYSVRTVGLPNLGALGVCFGRVITARSSSTGDLNWGMILWHELAHVFAIQISNSRVPRWYTEGLSEYETMIARPEWRRENDADVYEALASGRLPGVAELNHGFTKPDMQDVVVSYYLSAVTMEYIVNRYGFQRVVQGLEYFRDGDETPEVIEKITGKTVSAFDREFRDYLRQRLAVYENTFRLPSRDVGDVENLAKATAKTPDDLDAWLDLARGRFFEGDANGAEAAAKRAIALNEASAVAHYLLAELALRRKDLDGAKAHYTSILKAGVDGAEIRGRLGTIAYRQGDKSEAERQLCLAKRLNPESAFPYQALAEIYEESGETGKALVELEGYVHLEQMQYRPLEKLVEAFVKQRQWHKVRHYGEMAIFVQPFDARMLMWVADAYLESDTAEKALFHYDSALLASPRLRRPAQAHLGRARALLALDRRHDAKTALDAAIALEPNFEPAIGLRKRLGGD